MNKTILIESINILKETNINTDIKSPKVQLISEDGKNLGIVDTRDALYQGSISDLDLVQIGIQDNIPICKLINYGKFKYEQHKKQSDAKKKQQKQIVKEIKLSPRIENHDIMIKINRINDFIKDNNLVKVVMTFRGRENSHKEIGLVIMDKFKNIPGTTYSDFNSMGNTISLLLTPVKS